MGIRIKRIYDKPDKSDGLRILVDRLWPRGLTREKAKIDLWLKDIAPSTELRKWSGHDPDKWQIFKKRYFAELKKNASAVESLKKEIKAKDVTFLYAAKDTLHNNAAALLEFLEENK